jgi:MFS family permease
MEWMSDTSVVTAQKQKLFYGWRIVIASTLVITVTYGVIYSFGIFLPYYQKAFQADSATVSGAYSLCLLVYMGSAILSGWAADRFSPKTTTLIGGALITAGFLLTSRANAIWQLYLGYTIIGLGMSPNYNPLIATVSRWFNRKRGMALGILSTGIGAGPLLFSPFISYLTTAVDWRLTLVIIGSIAGIVIIGSAFILKGHPSDMNLLPYGETRNSCNTEKKADCFAADGFTLKQALKTKTLWQLVFTSLMFGFGLQVLMSHLVPYAEWRGLNPITAAVVLSTVSGVSIIGRMVMGTASDRFGRARGLALCLFGQGIMTFALAFAFDSWMLFLFAGVIGFFYGGYPPQLPALVSDNLGLAHLGVILGVTSTAWGIGSAVSPIMTGYIVDTTGNYPVAFIVGGIVVVLGGMMCLFVRKPERIKLT